LSGASAGTSPQGKDSEDYFPAGRGLGWWLIGFSIVAALFETVPQQKRMKYAVYRSIYEAEISMKKTVCFSVYFLVCSAVPGFTTIQGAEPISPDNEAIVAVNVADVGLRHSRKDAKELDLSGMWQVRLAPEGELFDVMLPGSLALNGLGNDVTAKTRWTGNLDFMKKVYLKSDAYARYREPGNVKIPSFLQPVKHFVGPAWYTRKVEIPQSWEGKRITLELERCHWTSKVSIDGREAGERASLSVPHVYDLTEQLIPGRHNVTIEIDNRIRVVDREVYGTWAHSVTDFTQTNWNGVIGRMALKATDRVWIENLQVYPDLTRKAARITLILRNATGAPVKGSLKMASTTLDFIMKGVRQRIEMECLFDKKTRLWDEHSPDLLTLHAAIRGEGFEDEASVEFGLRTFGHDGRQFLLNDRKIFLRGTLECCIFPLTGYPPMETAPWIRIYRIMKAHGLNHLRFHSWCPPEAAFSAADREGILLQVELPLWSAKVGVDPKMEPWLREEMKAILEEYGNHPSFCLMCNGNELEGDYSVLERLVEFGKELDSRHLYSVSTARKHCPVDDYYVSHRTEHGPIRGIRGPSTDWDFRDSIAPLKVPAVSHEIGQFCAYPNFKEMKKYTGVLKARNFEIFRESLKENGMLDQAEKFLMASGKLQAICYKEEIEAALRTPGFGGYQLLDLHDFPGQGTALVGVLDAFWDSKGYENPDQYRCFAGATVPLARFARRVWTSDESLDVRVEIAHFGNEPLLLPRPRWKITGHEGRILDSGSFTVSEIPLGNGFELGEIRFPLAGLEHAEKLTLTVSLMGTTHRNSWDFWIYPKEPDTTPPPFVLMETHMSDQATAHLDGGGKVLLMPDPGRFRDASGMAFYPVFWNAQMFTWHKSLAMGIVLDPGHSVFGGFPTDFHADWQWWGLLNGSRAVNMGGLPEACVPLVRVIDDWNTNRRQGLLFECSVGEGKLMVCAMDLETKAENDPAARQLLHSVLAYMASDDFQPEAAVDRGVIGRMVDPPSLMQKLKIKATADSEESGGEVRNLLDGDAATIWHTEWRAKSPGYPHWVLLEIEEPLTIRGLRLQPRQDGANGRIGEYNVFISTDGKRWGKGVVARGSVNFETPRTGRFVKLLALKPVNPDHPWASLAELELIIDDSIRNR